MKISTETKILLISFLIYAILTKTDLGTDTGLGPSRFATVESLVERGTFIIDDSQYVYTVDKGYYNGHFYSDKPPLFSVFSAGIYFVLYHVFGLSFTNNLNFVYYFLTLFTVGISSSLILVLTYKIFTVFKIEKRKTFYTFLLGFATLLFSYSTMYQSKTPAALFILLIFYLILKSKTNNCNSKFVFLAGISTGILINLAVPEGGIFAMCLSIYFVLSKRMKQLFIYLLGTSMFVIIFALLNIPITGDVLPGYWHKEGYDLPGGAAYPDAVVGGAYHPENYLWYSFNSLFFKRGLFSYNPILLFSLIGFYVMLIMKKPKNIKWETITIMAGIFLSALFYLTFTSNYAGYSFGFRYFVTIIPSLFVFIAFYTPKTKIMKILFYVFIIISFIVSFLGSINPLAVNPLAHIIG